MLNVKDLSDNELVKDIKENGSDESFIELINRHKDLFYRVCHKYLNPLLSLGYNSSELFEQRDSIFFDSIQKFDPEKGSRFSTWLCNCTRFFCLNKMHELKKHTEIHSDEFNNFFNQKSLYKYEDDNKPKASMSNILKALQEKNNNLIVNVFKLRYDPDKRKKESWASIAAKLNLTVKTTMKLHQKGIQTLREMVKDNFDVYEDVLKT